MTENTWTIRYSIRWNRDGMDGQLSLFTESRWLGIVTCMLAGCDGGSRSFIRARGEQRIEGTVDAGGDEAASNQLTSRFKLQQEVM